MTSTAPGAPHTSRRRVLVVANDGLPYPGRPVSGSGLRAWGLGQGLLARGHDVAFAMPRVAAGGPVALASASEGGPLLYDDPELRDLVIGSGAEVVVFQHWPRVGVAMDLDVAVALDLHGPLMVESAFQRRPDLDLPEMARVKVDAFRRADFITCAGDQQRKYFLPWLMLAGGDPTCETIAWIPVSLPPEAPAHDSSPDEMSFVYGGMFLPWQDPSLGLTTLVGVLEKEQRGRLDFFGARHPQFEMSTGVFESLEARLAASDRVVVHGLRPRDELIEHYRHSWVAFDLMRRNNERELAFTSRTAEYLWCGLPVVYQDYGELSPLISDYEAGWVVDPDDGDGLADVLRGILAAPDEVARRGANAARLAHERLNWERSIDPLDEFCRSPVRTERDPALLVGRAFTGGGWPAVRGALRTTGAWGRIAPLRRVYRRLRR